MAIIDALNKILGDPNKKELRKIQPLVGRIREIQKSDAMQSLTLGDLPGKTQEFKDRISKGETLDNILPEAFALVARASNLLIGKEYGDEKMSFTWSIPDPFDVQLLGGIALHKGMIAEMRTGEGKTYVCTFPVYLNALAGKGVHVVTVNDYLARRDALWMSALYEALGLSVGVIVHGLNHDQRKEAYAADVTYGTNNEFGFDYLRDNMAVSLERQVQRGLHYAIVDEVDSILIDEARTPLIISQPAGESTEKYSLYSGYVRSLTENTHFIKDEKQKTAALTEDGIKFMEGMLNVENIYTDKGFEEVHHIEQALRAHAMYSKDVDYVVKDGQIIIVDEFTGRLMPGRRYSHGLHQAIEAKEGVEVQRESKTLATITFQNYFRLFGKLAGMTGTAKTEEEEFMSIYRLPVLVVPTNRSTVRRDYSDAVYATVKAKFRAVAKIAKEKHEKGQPVLIGTTSIEKSEVMSLLLGEMDVPHNVLNAKQHEKEAEIVAKAGEKGAVTIATNMAGRGTDIKLGAGVKEVGGLAILGTERHESRRIDNQLRGRSGRQGDPGESRFFVSMEDDLMRLFGGDRLKSMMQRLKVPEDVPLENVMVSRSIEGAQKKVEGRNFDIRRHVVQYDDVMNKHREIMYSRRQKLLNKIAAHEGEDSSLRADSEDLMKRDIATLVAVTCADIDPENWDIPQLRAGLAALHPDLSRAASEEDLRTMQNADEIETHLSTLVLSMYHKKLSDVPADAASRAEQILTLQSIDSYWMDHIDQMAHLREQVAFSGFAQRDPLIEYKDQGFRLFQKLLSDIATTTVRALLQVDFRQFISRTITPDEPENLQTNDAEIEGALQTLGAGDEVRSMQKKTAPQGAMRSFSKAGRNDPCPCGSGKKYKKCHGA